MDIDLRVFPDLDRKCRHLASAPCLFVVDGKAQPLVEGNEAFGVCSGDGDVINNHGWHVRPPFYGSSRCAPGVMTGFTTRRPSRTVQMLKPQPSSARLLPRVLGSIR